MQYAQTIIRRDPWDVGPRLAELGLHARGIRRVRSVAVGARANATAFHAANAPGTFAYHAGLWCLRDEFVDGSWIADRPGGVEVIFDPERKLRVAFANVDRCCDDLHSPLPVSAKGAGVERLCQANLFSDLPTYANISILSGTPLFYCMVDLEGRVELSRPTFKDRSFGPCVERNFIALGGDDGDDGEALKPVDVSPVVLTPTITRKAA